ncbi:MAG: stage II sporulation protein R [Clostridia bacterium]|nr:stage II sporulation protein R [Clostridia bacterium]
MKTIVTFSLCLCAIVTLVFFLPVSGEEAIYDDVLRLHVLADSDDTADQTAKLLVRDALLATYGEAFTAQPSKDAAAHYLEENLPAVEATVRDTLTKHGYDYEVDVALTSEHFDTRSYGELTLPAGEYAALKVTLGKGEGQNFWCMLYPALCTEPAKGEQLKIAADTLNEEEFLLVTDSGYAVKLRALEILSLIFK